MTDLATVPAQFELYAEPQDFYLLHGRRILSSPGLLRILIAGYTLENLTVEAAERETEIEWTFRWAEKGARERFAVRLPLPPPEERDRLTIAKSKAQAIRALGAELVITRGLPPLSEFTARLKALGAAERPVGREGVVEAAPSPDCEARAATRGAGEGL